MLLTLQPIVYLVAKRDEENEMSYKEVLFGRADATRLFDDAFFTHGNLVSSDIERAGCCGCKTTLFRNRWMANIL